MEYVFRGQPQCRQATTGQEQPAEKLPVSGRCPRLRDIQVMMVFLESEKKNTAVEKMSKLLPPSDVL
jgi:hypothetical protein